MVIYAIQNVILEQKLSKFSAFPLLVYFYLAMLPLALVGWAFLKFTNQPVPSPSGQMLLLTCALGVLCFIADSCFVGAFTSGGQVLTIAAIIVLYPALAATVKYFWKGNSPNSYLVMGYVCAVAAVIFLTKGSVAPSAK